MAVDNALVAAIWAEMMAALQTPTNNTVAKKGTGVPELPKHHRHAVAGGKDGG